MLRQNPAYRPRDSFLLYMRTPSLFIAALSGAFLLGGCSRSVPEQTITRSVPQHAIAAATPTVTAAWGYRASPTRHQFVVAQRALLTIRQDTTTRTDSVFSRTEVGYTVFASTGRLTGSVTTFRAQLGTGVAATPSGLRVPFTFVGTLSASRHTQLEFLSPAGATTPCASVALSVSHSLRDLWFQPPDTLHVGTSWEDSATVMVCRDGVPLRSIVRRTFRVRSADGAAGRVILTVVRTSRAIIEGEGAQSGEAVKVNGDSAGELVYVIDPATGTILSAEGVSTLHLQLSSRLRNQEIRQTAEMRISPAITAK